MTDHFSSQDSEESDNEPFTLKTENGNLKPHESVKNPILELKTGPLFTKIFVKKKLWRKPDSAITPEVNEFKAKDIIIKNEIPNGDTYTNTFISYVMPPIKLDEQLSDVWLDVKNLNQTGPMSCMVCMEWFINKSKLILHYVLNHNKAFCGTCRYLVSDSASWNNHWGYHLPLRCSHCEDEFMDETGLRTHYISCHDLGHCRMCNLMLPSGKLYKSHLFNKHNVTITQNDDKENVWTVINSNSWIFSCLLCEKTNIPNHDFLRHFLYHHKFSLKCLSSLINGKNLGFSVLGASINSLTSPDNPTNEMENLKAIGLTTDKNSVSDNDNDMEESFQFLEALIPEIKQEVISDDENGAVVNYGLFKNDLEMKRELETLNPGNDLSIATEKFLLRWSGREDFDVTLVEFISIRRIETDYVNQNYLQMNSSKIFIDNNIYYSSESSGCEMACPLCYPRKSFSSLLELTEHLVKSHSLKNIPNFSCRMCTVTFHTYGEMEKHFVNKRHDFKDLYICQLCDKESKSRELAREHLNIHWEDMKTIECTSPTLGLKCKYCALLFWHEIDRERHHCQVHYMTYKDHFYRCKNCEMIFSEKIWWAAHELQEHPQPGEDTASLSTWTAFKCGVCVRVFRAIADLREHFLDLHPTERRLYCAIAGCISKPFRMARYLKQHREVVHSGDRGPLPDGGLECDLCGKVLHSVRAAATHRTVVHGAQSTTRFKCRICFIGLPSIQDRKLHYLVVHPGVAPFSCSVCGKGYNNKSALYTHRTQSHSVNMLTYTCQFCNKIFNKRDSYKEHLLIHVGPRHACPHCSRVFVQRSNMLRHIRLHTGEKPYPCIHCDKTFADKGACNAHIRTHTRQDVNACMYCGQEFLQKQKLKYHLRKHTGEDLETCVVCSKKFTNTTNLREHMKTHDDSHPVSCPTCGKAFMSHRYMERHIRDAHSSTAEVHPCPLCGRSCPRLSALRHHLMTHSTLKHLQCLICGKQYNGKKSMNKHLIKRHGITSSDDQFSTSFNQLDPRQCGLGLDEETICRVFGPEKNVKHAPILNSNEVPLQLHKKVKTFTVRSKTDDRDYKPTLKIEVNSIKSEALDSINDDDGPISGLDLANLRSRVKRESSRNVKYSYGSDDDDDQLMFKRAKRKGKVKYKKKNKNTSVSSAEKVLEKTKARDEADYDDREPMFPLVEVKCEPIDYDE